MAHMFRVDYITNHVNGMVEHGKVIVVAESHDLAHDLVCRQLNLPSSRTRCDSTKIKPPIYQVENHHSYPEKKAALRTQRDPSEAPAPVQRYHLVVTASNVNGQNEQQIMRKVGEELCARGTQTKLRHNLQMTVDLQTTEPSETAGGHMSALEKIEFYQPRTKAMQGGQTRSK